MLVLSRAQNERVYCSQIEGWVSVERISSKSVRLGLNFPERIKILRAELSLLSPKKTSGKKRDLSVSKPDSKESSSNKKLVLSRKKGEQILIGDHVTLTIVEIRGSKVRLGFDGPLSVKFTREELHQEEKISI